MRIISSYAWQSVYARITHSPARQLFFIFALVQCVLQTILRATALGEDVQVTSLVNAVFNQLPPSDPVHTAFLVVENGTVLACDDLSGTPSRVCISIANLTSYSNDNLALRNVREEDVVDEPHSLGVKCQRAMIFPRSIFGNAEREDSTLTLFQLWLFVLAITGLFQDSVPHITANFAGQLINAIWAVFRFQLLTNWHEIYQKDVVEAACGGVDILADIWDARNIMSVAILASNFALVFISAFICFKLIRRFMQATYSRVGASSKIARVYRWVLAFSMALHGGFFIAATLAIWISKIVVGSLEDVTPEFIPHLVLSGVALAIVPLWMLMGWKSMCLECGNRFAIFCVTSCVLLGTFCAMFASPAFTAVASFFPFFAALSVLSCAYLIVAVLLGVICRFQFGSGLAHFLEVQAILARDGFAAATFTQGSSIDERERGPSFDDDMFKRTMDRSSVMSELGIAKKPLFVLFPAGRDRSSFVPLEVPITDHEHVQGLRRETLKAARLSVPAVRPPPAAQPGYLAKQPSKATLRSVKEPDSFLKM